MRLIPVMTLLVGVMASGSAFATTGEDCAAALDAGAELVSATLTLGTEEMIGLRGAMGHWQPIVGPTQCVLVTGRAGEPWEDADLPPAGGEGDEVRLRLEWDVPSGAKSFKLRHRAFTLESYWDEMLDTAEAELTGTLWSGPLFVSTGNDPLYDRETFFEVRQTAWLVGTGFADYGSATGWFVATAPVAPGDRIAVEFRVVDDVGGLWDTMLVVDAFAWSPDVVSEGSSAFSDGTGEPSQSLWLPEDPAPLFDKALDAQVDVLGPGTVVIRGGPMTEVTGVLVAGEPAEFFVSDMSRLRVTPPLGSVVGLPEGGLADITLQGPFGDVTFPDVIEYIIVPPTPSLLGVEPRVVEAGYPSEVVVRGVSLDGLTWSMRGRGSSGALEPIDGPSPADENAEQEVRFAFTGLASGNHEIRLDHPFSSTSYGVVSITAAPREGGACTVGGEATPWVGLVLLGGVLVLRRRRPVTNHGGER